MMIVWLACLAGETVRSELAPFAASYGRFVTALLPVHFAATASLMFVGLVGVDSAFAWNVAMVVIAISMGCCSYGVLARALATEDQHAFVLLPLAALLTGLGLIGPLAVLAPDATLAEGRGLAAILGLYLAMMHYMALAAVLSVWAWRRVGEGAVARVRYWALHAAFSVSSRLRAA